ncbi:MAG: FAD-binding oxidoreductase [Burkholderiales bacterium]
MELHGWGRHPRVQAQVVNPASREQAVRSLAEPGALIARGLGRSYGDSSLAPRVLAMRPWDRFRAFDEASGVLECDAGVSLKEILDTFVPRGWFLPVTPGTRYVTVGGAIAADVHGKNHHVDGSFSRHVERIDLLLGNGQLLSIGPTTHPELFEATCGGMGLTGVVLAAGLRLQRIASSDILQTTHKLPNLEAALEAFEHHAGARYSVAWIDCLARGRHLGRSLLSLGEHAADGPLRAATGAPLPVPFDSPAALLNPFTMRAFNALYHGRVRRSGDTRRVPFEPFFYPLDALGHWNRLYGKPGFLQYQFVLPKASGAAGLREILERIAASGRGSFLAVLKAFGPGNRSPLSFPLEGFTLALDFKAEPAAFTLLDQLDPIVLAHGGRLYLAKDARMSQATFRHSYPRWAEFEALRQRYHAVGHFASAQSRRLGLQ